MNYEKKYKAALELARDYYKANLKLNNADENLVLEDIFPELAESEDEKIRKAILKYFTKCWGNCEDNVCGIHVEDVIAWLEKQGEQKPGEEYNGEDFGIDSLYHAQRILEKTLGEVEGYQSDDGILEHKCAISAVKKLYEQKPVWGEEDECYMTECINAIATKDSWSFEEKRNTKHWLKSLKERVQPQPKQEWSDEDESIRKAIIEFFELQDDNTTYSFVPKKDILAWLEKQKAIDVLDAEEREFADNVNSYRKDMDEFYKKGYDAGREAEKQYWLGKQDENKKEINNSVYLEDPTDKVEPKFHEGDWAVSNLDRKARQISEVHFDEYNSYYVVDGKSVNLEEYDRLHHLWAIADAKDGDVLAAHECYVIFKEIDGLNIKCYCTYHYMNNPSFHVDTLHNKDAFYPATKEQCSILFSKMKEAGYEWDTENKELINYNKKGSEK